MRGILTFLRDERGSQTIEFVLWLPIIGALLAVISYASILYMTHTEMWNVARDTARRLTVGTLLPADAEAYARSQLKLYEVFGTGYQIIATEDEAASTMTVVIRLGAGDAAFDAGFLGGFSLVGGTMAARVVMRTAPT